MDTNQYKHFLSMCCRDHTDEATRFAFSDWLLENGQDRLSALVAKYPIIRLENISVTGDTIQGMQSMYDSPAPKCGTIVLIATNGKNLSGPYYIRDINAQYLWRPTIHINITLRPFTEWALC